MIMVLLECGGTVNFFMKFLPFQLQNSSRPIYFGYHDKIRRFASGGSSIVLSKEALEVFGNEKFLEEIVACSEVSWLYTNIFVLLSLIIIPPPPFTYKRDGTLISLCLSVCPSRLFSGHMGERPGCN